MTLKINNKIINFNTGQSILEIATENKIKIPSLCYHPDLEVKANCRICVVEIKGWSKLATACSTEAKEGMEIFTNSSRVKLARKVNLELIFIEHTKKCADCISVFDCELLRLAREYKVESGRLPARKAKRRTYRFAQAVEIDGSQCIDCRNCITACDKQKINYLELSGSGANQEIKPKLDKKSACIYCGQCALHCPAASAQEQSAWPAVEKLILDKSKITVAQIAPAVRVSIGEEFGLPYGTNCEGKIYSALKKLGFKYVTDINFGADITTMVEATELLERLKDKKAVWPMTTSCCPAWVAYAEFYHPELIPNLTSARSPHIHSAGALKTYWAKKQGILAKRIKVISIVPCTAKKYEAGRPELTLNGEPLVDYVLTTRELAYLIKKHGIDFKKLQDSEGIAMFNKGSGAAAIYGASGGVMESALRTAVALSGNTKSKISNSRLEFKEVRGLAGLKESTVEIGGRKIKVAVVNGIGNFPRILKKLNKYHYVEIMACPGGCLGGGGQPIPTTNAIRLKRLAGMYNIDTTRSVRRAHENKAMTDYYNWAINNHLTDKVLHTKFKRSSGTALSSVHKHKKSLFSAFF